LAKSHERREVREMNIIHVEIAEYQKKLDAAKKELREAVGNLDMADEIILGLREQVRILSDKLHALDAQILKR
jgi:hypothetical protein